MSVNNPALFFRVYIQSYKQPEVVIYLLQTTRQKKVFFRVYLPGWKQPDQENCFVGCTCLARNNPTGNFQLGTSSMNSKLTGQGVDDDDIKKMSESQTKAGNQEKFKKFTKI